MLTDNSQSLLYGGTRISLRVSGCLYVMVLRMPSADFSEYKKHS